MPNAGKSTLLGAVSRAHPKIGDYPFTTLHPNLGVVYARGNEFIMADIPGLIKGASKGAGLGTRFLGHVERCRVLLHLVDGTEEDVVKTYHIVRHEVEAYGEGLREKRQLVVLTKVDALAPDIARKKCEILSQACKDDVLVISGISGDGIKELLDKLMAEINPDVTIVDKHEAFAQ